MKVAIAFLLLTSTTLAGGFPPPPADLGRFPPPPKLVSVEVEKPDVQLLLFGATWCSTCPEAKRHAEELKRRGWKVSTFDVDDTTEPWVKFNNATHGRSVPHWIVLSDGKPIEHFFAARDVPFIEDMLKRAENEWRFDHGLEEIPFKAIGDTTDPNPVNQEYFYREHWRLDRGSCGMAGCTIHGGGWRKVIEKVPVEEKVETRQSTSSNNVRRGCPSCR